MRRMRDASPRLDGFTLVELLVVIAIIGVLVALLLPAIQAARESARRSQCMNNVKQINLAIQNYHGTMGRIPAGAAPNDIDEVYDYWDEAANGKEGYSWMLAILPYMEQTASYDRWDFHKNVLGNALVAQADFSTFYCPSRRFGVRVGTDTTFQGWQSGGNDYAGCIGWGNCFYDDYDGDFHKPCNHAFGHFSSCGRFNKYQNEFRDFPDVSSLGVFAPKQTIAFKQILDGLSQTIFVAEAQRGSGEEPWLGNECTNTNYDGWALAGISTMFDVQFGTLNDGHYESPGSEHPGIALFGFGDGSARVLSENIAPHTLRKMASFEDSLVVESAQ